jgi:hypothetical protein
MRCELSLDIPENFSIFLYMKKTKFPFVVIRCDSSALSGMVLALLKDFGCDVKTLENHRTWNPNLGAVGNFVMSFANEISPSSDGRDWYYNYIKIPKGCVVFDAATQMGDLIEWLTKAQTQPKLEVLLKKDYTATVEGDGTKVKVGCQEFSTASLQELMDKINKTFPLWNL